MPILFQLFVVAFSFNRLQNCPKLYSTSNLKILFSLYKKLKAIIMNSYLGVTDYLREQIWTKQGTEPKLQIPKRFLFGSIQLYILFFFLNAYYTRNCFDFINKTPLLQQQCITRMCNVHQWIVIHINRHMRTVQINVKAKKLINNTQFYQVQKTLEDNNITWPSLLICTFLLSFQGLSKWCTNWKGMLSLWIHSTLNTPPKPADTQSWLFSHPISEAILAKPCTKNWNMKRKT